MNMTPFDRIRGVGPLALHPFEVGEPGAILVLIDHPRRQQRQIAGEFRERERKLLLRFEGLVGWHGGSREGQKPYPRSLAVDHYQSPVFDLG